MRSMLHGIVFLFGLMVALPQGSYAHTEESIDFSKLKNKRGVSCCGEHDCHLYPDSVVDMSHYHEGYIRVKITFGKMTGNPRVYLESIIDPPPGVPDGYVVVCHAGLEIYCVALQKPFTS